MNDDGDRIEASLRRVFAPPDLSALQARIEAAATRRGEVVPMRRRPIVALGAAAAAVAVLLLARRDEPAAVPPTMGAAEPIAVDPGRVVGLRLAQLHATGPGLPRPDDANCFADPPPPSDACAGDVPRLDPGDDLEVLGECGAPGGLPCDRDAIPAARLLHLRHRDGAELLVCIAPRHADPRPSLPIDAGLTIFRREVGAFIAYEVTPLPEPHALARLTP